MSARTSEVLRVDERGGTTAAAPPSKRLTPHIFHLVFFHVR